MKLTVLGKYGPYPRAGGACSGYLLEEDNYKILIDCGNGTLSRLLGYIDTFDDIHSIILTHLHNDHMSDIMILRYGIALNKETGLIKNSIPLYTPINPKETFDSLQFMDAFIINPLNEERKLEIGNMRFSFKAMAHSVETYSIIVESKSKKFVYSSDTKLCNSIYEIAKNADLLLCECNLLEKDRKEDIFHLSAIQVGEIANASKVQNLLLTHIWPEYSKDEIIREVKTNFSGSVNIAEEFRSYEI